MVYRNFQPYPEVQTQFLPVMDELTAAGYLTRTVYLVDRTRPGTFGEDYANVTLSDDEAAEAIACQRDRKPFVNPDTGDERVPGPEDIFMFYCTTAKVPVLPPPPDPRGVEIHARLLRERKQVLAAIRAEGDPLVYHEARLAGRAEAFKEAAEIVAAAYGFKPPVEPA